MHVIQPLAKLQLGFLSLRTKVRAPYHRGSSERGLQSARHEDCTSGSAWGNLHDLRGADNGGLERQTETAR